MARVLAPGGHLLLAFQTGEDVLRLTDAGGHEVDLDFHRWQPDRVAGQLERAGLAPLTVLETTGLQVVEGRRAGERLVGLPAARLVRFEAGNRERRGEMSGHG